MQFKFSAMAAAFALSAFLGACGETQNTQQTQQPPQGGDGGYGPFAGDTQQPPPAIAPPPMNAGPSGAETVVAGAGGDVPQEFQALVAGYLNDYNRQMAAGWPQIPGVPDVITGLQPGGEHRWQVSLRGGQRYGFIGACDNECSNVDLVVEDASGAIVNSDVLGDDYPLVDVTPRQNGVYTVRIQLKSCSVGPCYVGARLVREP
jgi:hypothetical protein